MTKCEMCHRLCTCVCCWFVYVPGWGWSLGQVSLLQEEELVQGAELHSLAALNMVHHSQAEELSVAQKHLNIFKKNNKNKKTHYKQLLTAISRRII